MFVHVFIVTVYCMFRFTQKSTKTTQGQSGKTTTKKIVKKVVTTSDGKTNVTNIENVQDSTRVADTKDMFYREEEMRFQVAPW